MGKNMSRRAVEFGKDILIVLLTCSALWLAMRAQLFGTLSGLFQEEDTQVSTDQIQTEARAEAARPLRMTAILAQGTETIRYGAQYNEAASDTLFQQVAGLLMEALSSAGEPRQIQRRQWETALTNAPGVCFDFQGEIPLSVLTGWLSGEDTQLEGTVRRLVLTVYQEAVVLCYQDERDGNYYRCQAEVVNPLHLEEALSGLSGNGAFYAFESEEYSSLNPDTLVLEETVAPAVYTASNPVSGGRTDLETLADELEFSINANGVYYAGEWVARSGNDTLRLSNVGEVVYLAGDEESDHFLVSDDNDLFESVEACRRLAAAAVGSRCGQARLYLMSVTDTGPGWEIQFGYSLNGIPVRLSEGCAASFQVQDGRIDEFSLRIRNYISSGETSVVLPPRQAAAAMEAMGLAGEELTLLYVDHGGEALSANWNAADWESGKR